MRLNNKPLQETGFLPQILPIKSRFFSETRFLIPPKINNPRNRVSASDFANKIQIFFRNPVSDSP
ncbi:MAG: hypothetical protein AUK43_01935 [Oscillatoriales cyanobacterium CG2_30_40_61]|nr:MAG: hypothetical protein AUK43_01935 [Oscillatoriales cyanobacterium CG2_30_40_61]